jgi:hypothetical protein
MRDCLILGCGRSGTSMLSGTLAGAGYYMGNALYRPRSANPKGFYESRAINAINERLLAPHAPLRSRWWPLRVWRHLFPSERWLARLPPEIVITAPPRLARRIARQVAHRPFAFKDPRFCYTLSAWRPLLPKNTAFLCIFREPGRTVKSILVECRRKYPDIRLSEEEVFGIWTAMYERVLNARRHEGEWLFLHFDQLLNGSAIPAIEQLLGASVNRDFAEPGLSRAQALEAPANAIETYRALCTLAGCTP